MDLAPIESEPQQPEVGVLKQLFQEGFTVHERINPTGSVPIYRAVKRSLGQEVALKVMPLTGPSHEKKVSRFVQEAKAQARLRHRNIVAIYDVRQCARCVGYFDVNRTPGIFGRPDELEDYICMPCAEAMSAREYYERFIEGP